MRCAGAGALLQMGLLSPASGSHPQQQQDARRQEWMAFEASARGQARAAEGQGLLSSSSAVTLVRYAHRSCGLVDARRLSFLF